MHDLNKIAEPSTQKVSVTLRSCDFFLRGASVFGASDGIFSFSEDRSRSVFRESDETITAGTLDPSPQLYLYYRQDVESVQLRPEADRVTAGGISHRIVDTQTRQARRATQWRVSIVSPSGLSMLWRFRSLTAPAVIMSASGLIPRRKQRAWASQMWLNKKDHSLTEWRTTVADRINDKHRLTASHALHPEWNQAPLTLPWIESLCFPALKIPRCACADMFFELFVFARNSVRSNAGSATVLLLSICCRCNQDI